VTDHTAGDRPANVRAGSPASREVSWWATHQFIEAAVAQANCGPLPAAGTPAWCALSDGDPRKLLALAVAGEHHVLRMEIGQELLIDAGKNVAAAIDCTALAQRIRNRDTAAYIPRKKTA
jgi:hypothetical protein